MSALRIRRTGRARSSRLTLGVVVVTLFGALLAGCSSSVYETTALPSPSAAPTTAAPSASPTSPPACANPLASYAPPPAGFKGMLQSPDISNIEKRGRLIVGVSADTLLLGARNPISGKVEGFDIDMAHLVAKAIFGDANKLELRVITAADRIPVLQDKSVDLVARNMTINCARWEQIGFSAEYYRSGQKVLVPLDSTATSLADLAGKRVCAPAGSTSLDKLKDFPKVIAVSAPTHTECLVRFQQAAVDAITGDDTVLAGLVAQDPYAKVVGKAFTSEPYGLGMNKEHTDLIRFVNYVLAQAEADGSWKASYDKWLAAALGPAPAPPVANYGRG